MSRINILREICVFSRVNVVRGICVVSQIDVVGGMLWMDKINVGGRVRCGQVWLPLLFESVLLLDSVVGSIEKNLFHSTIEVS